MRVWNLPSGPGRLVDLVSRVRLAISVAVSERQLPHFRCVFSGVRLRLSSSNDRRESGTVAVELAPARGHDDGVPNDCELRAEFDSRVAVCRPCCAWLHALGQAAADGRIRFDVKPFSASAGKSELDRNHSNRQGPKVDDVNAQPIGACGSDVAFGDNLQTNTVALKDHPRVEAAEYCTNDSNHNDGPVGLAGRDHDHEIDARDAAVKE